MSSRFLNRTRNVAASNSRCTPSSTHQTKIQKTKKKPARKRKNSKLWVQSMSPKPFLDTHPLAIRLAEPEKGLRGENHPVVATSLVYRHHQVPLLHRALFRV